MKKKCEKGFFLSETMVVLAIVAIVLITVFKLFSATYIKFQESEKYNTANSINALYNIKKYYESFGEIDVEELLDDNDFIELTNDSKYESLFYGSIKEEYDIDSIYLVDMSTIKSNLSSFSILLRKYIESLPDSNDKILLINTRDNEFASINIENQIPTLVGNQEDEYSVYINLGEEFVDPGYTNWEGETPSTTWETPLDINTEGIYYLIYNFDNYIIRRKVQVIMTKYNYTGNVQIYRVPKTGTYKIELWGASPNNSYNSYIASLPTYGGYTAGNIELIKNEVLYVYVGGSKQVFNCCTIQGDRAGAGGATDIRLVNGNWNDSTSLISRIMVAGGGGGTYSDNTAPQGGTAGGLSSVAVDSPTHPVAKSTQTSGGAAGQTGTAGGFGYGGTNTVSRYNPGGGGYYGGGSGPSGGGGSSYISGYTGCIAVTHSGTPKSGCNEGTNDNSCSIHYTGKVFTNAIMKAGNEEMPTHDGTSIMIGNSGNGYAKITLID